MKGSTRTKTVTKASSDASKKSSNNALDDDDDDSSDDSDYDPNADGDDDDDALVEGGEEDAIVPEISVGRLKKAYEAWRDMVDEDVRSVSEIMAKAVNHEQKYGGIGSSSRSRKGGLKDESAAAARKAKAAIRKESIIAQIFGKKVARKMILGVEARRHSAMSGIDKGGSNSNSYSSNSIGSNDDDDGVRDRIKESVKKIMKKTKVLETKKFAGKEILVERVVYEEADSSNPSDIASKSSKQGLGGGNNKLSSGGGIDSVLDTIKGPKAISTVAKSSMDWELYKDKEGLEDELAKASKEGYLTRKDFLERCDYRSFEMEREVRLKEQAARGSANL